MKHTIPSISWCAALTLSGILMLSSPINVVAQAETFSMRARNPLHPDISMLKYIPFNLSFYKPKYFPAYNKENLNVNNLGNALPWIYLHAIGGWGIDMLFSQDIQRTRGENYRLNASSTPFTFGLRSGFRNIAQVDYRRSSSNSHPIVHYRQYFEDGELRTQNLSEEEFTYHFSEWIFKINPLFFKVNKEDNFYKVFFIEFGFGNSEYAGASGRLATGCPPYCGSSNSEAFNGESWIAGMEFGFVSKLASGSIGLRRSAIDFEEGMSASHYYLDVSLGLGYGL